MLADAVDTAPDDFARRDQRVQIRGRIARDTSRQELRLQERSGKRYALKGLDRIEKGIEASALLQNALPVSFEAGEKARLGGLDLLS